VANAKQKKELLFGMEFSGVGGELDRKPRGDIIAERSPTTPALMITNKHQVCVSSLWLSKHAQAAHDIGQPRLPRVTWQQGFPENDSYSQG
jgi:hypothetical protein